MLLMELIRYVVALVARAPPGARGPNVCFMASMAFWRIGAMRMEMIKVPMMGLRSCFSNWSSCFGIGQLIRFELCNVCCSSGLGSIEQMHLPSGLLRLHPDGSIDVLCGPMPGTTLTMLVPMMLGGAQSLRRHTGAKSCMLLRGGRRLPLLTMVAGRLSAGASPRAESRATLRPLVLCSLAKDQWQPRALAKAVAPPRRGALGLRALCALLIGALVLLIGTRVLLSLAPSTRCGRTLPWTMSSTRRPLSSWSAFAPLCSRARMPRTSLSCCSRAMANSKLGVRTLQKLSGLRPEFRALGEIIFVLLLSGWPSALLRRRPSGRQ
mmetsp:Transcript_42212/g.100609  ORF Transcript_42212/g.100609 Transcript_42212/m.100609 type:complete len:323 (+) Transcript_42212:6271-7239(+)